MRPTDPDDIGDGITSECPTCHGAGTVYDAAEPDEAARFFLAIERHMQDFIDRQLEDNPDWVALDALNQAEEHDHRLWRVLHH